MKIRFRAFAVVLLEAAALYKVEADVFEVNDTFPHSYYPLQKSGITCLSIWLTLFHSGLDIQREILLSISTASNFDTTKAGTL
jgi:hypothetical protein